MAGLDVTEILDGDPDFCDTISVIRRTQTINDRGRVEVAEVQWDIIAVVTQGAGDELDRVPEGALISSAITVHTIERLIVAQGDIDADEILFDGRRYIVTVLSDYSNFGRGFSAAVCTLKPISP